MARTSTAPALSDRDGSSALERAQRQPLMLGLFLPIQSGGWTPSSAPRGTDWSFGYNAELTMRAEEIGFDLVFALAQWRGRGGYGGVTRYRELSLDPLVVTAAMSAMTRNILLISTIHVLYGWHPLHVAKFGATIDHISGGRWGINVVTGFVEEESAMFGLPLAPHDERYAMAQEFLDFMEALWRSDANVTREGRYYRMSDAFVSPKPANGRPVIVNAGSSEAGVAFAARNCDLLFITSPAGADFDAAVEALPAHNARIKELARRQGRTLRTLINPMIICRETEREVADAVRAIVEAEDTEALDGLMGMFNKGDTLSWKGHKRAQRVVGGNIQIFGTPEQVAERLLRLHRAGCDGAQISFFDFLPELDFFGARVVPLLRQAGLRLG